MPGVMHYLQQGDAVTRGVAALLLAMSLLTWCIAIGKAWGGMRARRSARVAVDGFWRAATASDGVVAIASLDSEGLFAPLAAAAVAAADDAAATIDAADKATAAIDAAVTAALARDAMAGVVTPAGVTAAGVMPAQPSRGSGTAADPTVNPAVDRRDRGEPGDILTRALRQALRLAQRRLEAGLTLLATIASVAPFVGLLGTVWGIYHALIGIAASAQPSLTDVAGPVGEALTMTALGLAVAIPAVVAYNLLGRQVRLLREELDGFAHDLRAALGPPLGQHAEDGDGIRRI